MYSILEKKHQTLQKSIGALMRINFIPRKGCRTIFILVLFLFISYSGSAATYYVSNSGNDSNNGLSEATPWKTIAKVGGFKFADEDVILFNRGDVWRESMCILHDHLSFGAYGSGEKPIVDGADIIHTMSSLGTNIWQKTGLTIQPNLMYLNHTIGNQKISLGACTSVGDWYWDSGTKVLSVYSAIDPSGNIELGQRHKIFNLGSGNYINISNLTIQHSNENSIPDSEWWSGALYMSGVNFITIIGCTIQENGMYGVFAMNSSHLTFDRNTFLRNGESHKNGGSVRVWAGRIGVTDITFTNNQCNYNANGLLFDPNGKINHITNVDIHGNHFDHNNAAGLYIQMLDSVVVHNNYFEGNGDISLPESYGIGITSCDNTEIFQNRIINQKYNDGIQLYSDASSTYGSSNNVSIFRNYISGVTHGDCIGLGLLNDHTCQNLQIYCNTAVRADHAGISLFTGGGNASKVNIFNNTLYENILGGLRVSDVNVPIVLKNNIFYHNGALDTEFRLATSGLTHSNNLWYRTSGNVLTYNFNTFTIATIKGFEPSSQNTDPLFTDAAHGDFSLRTGSPAINAGVNVGLTKDILGKPVIGTPDIGAYEFNSPVFNSEFKSICEGSSYQGWTVTGKYERKLIAKSGVDSVVTTYLTVNPKYAVQEAVTINSGENYKGWTTSGTYSRTLNSVSGCDSVITTQLTVNISTIKVGELTQTIQLKKGTNMISTFLQATNPDISVVTQPIRDSGYLIKMQNESGNSYENWGIWGGWINNLGSLQLTEGYKITVANDCALQITGQQIALPLNISLKVGWNIISFPRTDILDAKMIIQSLIDQKVLVKVQDETGNSIEDWGIYGGWKNGIGNFVPGKAYRVKVNANASLTIQESYPKSSVIPVSTEPSQHFQSVAFGNGNDHMNINLIELNESGLSVGDEIAAFDGESCVGTIQITEQNLKDDLVRLIASSSTSTTQKDGFEEGNPIRLKLWKSIIGNESGIQVAYLSGTPDFSKNASMFGKMQALSTSIDNFEVETQIDVYPNPCRGHFTVRLAEMPVSGSRIDILDISGKMITSRLISNESEVFNLQNQVSGMYLVNTRIGSNSIIHQIIVNK